MKKIISYVKFIIECVMWSVGLITLYVILYCLTH